MIVSSRYQKFLSGLFAHERRRVEATVADALDTWPVPSKTCRPLRSGLWEARISLPTRIARVIFTHDGEEFRVLGGVIKKGGAEHEREIRAALSQMRRAA